FLFFIFTPFLFYILYHKQKILSSAFVNHIVYYIHKYKLLRKILKDRLKAIEKQERQNNYN
ncbi:MAG: hypothetical protein QXT38_04110, partial [Candidatus Aenigmatarchaeota archaeon]